MKQSNKPQQPANPNPNKWQQQPQKGNPQQKPQNPHHPDKKQGGCGC